MKGNVRVGLEMALELKNGKMGHIIKVNGILARLKEMELLIFQMDSNILGLGRIIWLMAKVYFIMKMEIHMKANF